MGRLNCISDGCEHYHSQAILLETLLGLNPDEIISGNRSLAFGYVQRTVD